MERILKAQAKIDEEICTLKKRLQYLLTFRNSIALINQLPAEIFVHIFRSCQPASFGDRRGTKEICASQFDQWLHITQVCQRWRSIAFGSKELWTTIPMHNDVYAELAFKLSKPLPISIIDTTNDVDEDDVEASSCDLYSSLLERAEKVEIRRSVGESYLVYALGEAHSVQELILDSLDITYLSGSPFPASLKSLTLSQCEFDWSWLELDQLTELHIKAMDAPEPVDFSWFVGHMQHLPSLCLLEVVNILRDDLEDPSFHLNLQHLVINDDITLVSKLLSYVNLKPDFTLMVELLYQANLDEGQTLMLSLDHHLQASQHVIRHVVLDCEDEGRMALSNHKRGFSCQFFDQDPSNPFVHINADVDTEMSRTWLDSILGLGMDQLQQLSVRGFSGVEEWRSWPFRDLHCLRELSMDTQSFDGFFECFVGDTLSADESNDWDHVLFPALKELTFLDIHYDEQQEVQLADVLRMRRNHGYGLERLSFVGGNITDEPDGTELMIKVADELTIKPAEGPRRARHDWRRKF
ncbi:hypothetical protein BDN72DRAFT_850213 [Pluteus cervinus]|uniref:Uncharacterized protein n=1 Tax=Pluteus cervinus TaxID=181527 RepID=A0ACD3A535_9AGAR|nr:hypothetical protein BDN72DRAFT_850213 [Pluteus cervinus]